MSSKAFWQAATPGGRSAGGQVQDGAAGFGCLFVVSLERLGSSAEKWMSLTELPAALDNALMVSRSGLQCAAVTSFGYKLQCLR